MFNFPEKVMKNAVTGLGAKPARGRVRTRVLVLAKPHPAVLLCDQHCHCRILVLPPFYQVANNQQILQLLTHQLTPNSHQ